MNPDRTPEQIVADEELEAALVNNLLAYDLLEEGAYLGDFIAVVAIADPVRRHSTAYSIIMSGAGLPEHISRGLIEVGARFLDTFNDD